MASSGRRSSRKDEPKSAERIGASFLKVIHQSTVRDRKLWIPREFVRDFVGGLLKWKSATLRVSDGEEWEVGLVRDGKGEVWVGGHEWERFAHYYSLEYGHHLFFRYLGGSTFFVVIFYRSGVEMVYPVRENAAATNQLEKRDDNKGKSPLTDHGDSGSKKKEMVVQQEEKQGSHD